MACASSASRARSRYPVRLAALAMTLSAPSGMIPAHVGTRAGRRPIHVADHPLLDRSRRHSPRTTLDAAAQARAAPRSSSRRSRSSPSPARSTPKVIEALEKNSPLGRVLAAALANRDRGREIMMERVEDTGRHVVHELERFLNTLGTIASISPLLGLLGTVTGIINAFNAVMLGGMGDPRMLAGGISEALITTAGGLAVAIPVVHRLPLPARQGRAHRHRHGEDRRDVRRFAGRQSRSADASRHEAADAPAEGRSRDQPDLADRHRAAAGHLLHAVVHVHAGRAAQDRAAAGEPRAHRQAEDRSDRRHRSRRAAATA